MNKLLILICFIFSGNSFAQYLPATIFNRDSVAIGAGFAVHGIGGCYVFTAAHVVKNYRDVDLLVSVGGDVGKYKINKSWEKYVEGEDGVDAALFNLNKNWDGCDSMKGFVIDSGRDSVDGDGVLYSRDVRGDSGLKRIKIKKSTKNRIIFDSSDELLTDGDSGSLVKVSGGSLAVYNGAVSGKNNFHYATKLNEIIGRSNYLGGLLGVKMGPQNELYYTPNDLYKKYSVNIFNDYDKKTNKTLDLNLIDYFVIVHPGLPYYVTQNDFERYFSKNIISKFSGDKGKYDSIDTADYNRIIERLIAIKLISRENLPSTNGGMHTWLIQSDIGKKLMMAIDDSQEIDYDQKISKIRILEEENEKLKNRIKQLEEFAVTNELKGQNKINVDLNKTYLTKSNKFIAVGSIEKNIHDHDQYYVAGSYFGKNFYLSTGLEFVYDKCRIILLEIQKDKLGAVFGETCIND